MLMSGGTYLELYEKMVNCATNSNACYERSVKPLHNTLVFTIDTLG